MLKVCKISAEMCLCHKGVFYESWCKLGLTLLLIFSRENLISVELMEGRLFVLSEISAFFFVSLLQRILLRQK
jgi:hypothetical protein